MIVKNQKGELLVNRYGEISHIDYDKVTSYEDFRFVFGRVRETRSEYGMFEVSSGVWAVKKSECPTAMKGRLAEAMCNKFLLKLHNAKQPLSVLVDNVKVRINRDVPFELWKTSLIG